MRLPVANSAWAVFRQNQNQGAYDLLVPHFGSRQIFETSTLLRNDSWRTRVAWSPNGSRLAASSFSTIRVWSPASRKVVRTLNGHDGDVLSVAWSPDNSRIASGADDGTIQIWNAKNGECLKALSDPAAWDCGYFSSVRWNPDGFRLAAGCGDRAVRVWDVASGDLTRLSTDFSLSTGATVTWSPDGLRLASASGEDIILWDVTSGEPLWNHSLMGAIGPIAWSPNGSLLAYSHRDEVRVLDATTLDSWNSKDGMRTLKRREPGPYGRIAWSPDSSLLASVLDEAVLIWDVLRSECVQILRGHRDRVSSVAWSPDGSRLASASRDIRVWSTLSK